MKLEGRVVVEGARPANDGDVYYVDVFVRRLRLLEELLPFMRPDGSTTVPEEQLLPPGTSEKQRDRQNFVDMARSEQIASAVALRALGYDVVATPRGALVIGVASNVPAARELDPAEVVLAPAGDPVVFREAVEHGLEFVLADRDDPEVDLPLDVRQIHRSRTVWCASGSFATTTSR
jgi:PDZ domain-containing secreted protein